MFIDRFVRHVFRSRYSCFYVLLFVTLYDPVVCHVLGVMLMLCIMLVDLVICPVFSRYLSGFQVSSFLLFRSHNMFQGIVVCHIVRSHYFSFSGLVICHDSWSHY